MVTLSKIHSVLTEVPLPLAQNKKIIVSSEDWMNSYKPEELFNADGSLKDELKAIAPKGDKRMSANPIANGGRRRGEERLI